MGNLVEPKVSKGKLEKLRANVVDTDYVNVYSDLDLARGKILTDSGDNPLQAVTSGVKVQGALNDDINAILEYAKKEGLSEKATLDLVGYAMDDSLKASVGVSKDSVTDGKSTKGSIEYAPRDSTFSGKVEYNDVNGDVVKGATVKYRGTNLRGEVSRYIDPRGAPTNTLHARYSPSSMPNITFGASAAKTSDSSPRYGMYAKYRF